MLQAVCRDQLLLGLMLAYMKKEYPKQFLMEFGHEIAISRHKKGLTQEQLAEVTNLHRTYIGFIEQGKRNPSIGNIYNIAKALDIKLKDIFNKF